MEKRLEILEGLEGAKRAAKSHYRCVLVDTFRASNTILALVEKGVIVHPVQSVEEALSLPYIKIGEVNGYPPEGFDVDNSPVKVAQSLQLRKGDNVAFRTSNGTQGILAAVGSSEIIIGSPRNASAIGQYLSRSHEFKSRLLLFTGLHLTLRVTSGSQTCRMTHDIHYLLHRRSGDYFLVAQNAAPHDSPSIRPVLQCYK